MKICIPVENNEGINSKVNAHFGSAPYFLTYDTDKETFEIISNSNKHHLHGSCHPLKTLETQNIDAVVCQGMGARAIQSLNTAGIRAYRADARTAKTIIERYRNGLLEEISVEDACLNHNCQ